MNKSKIALIAAISTLTTAGLTVPMQNAAGNIFDTAAITAYAADQVYTGTGFTLNYTINGSTATITGFKKTTSAASVNVTVPSQINGKTVTQIGTNAFNGGAVNEVTLPTSVTALGGGAFRNCAQLTKITLSDKITVANSGSYLFTNSPKLKTIVVAGSGNMADADFLKTHIWVLSGCTVQGELVENSYKLNYKIQNADNTSNGAEIISFTKTSSASVVSVNIPEKINGYDVKKIGNSAFNSAPVSELTMPDTVTTLGTHVFIDNSQLTKITLSKNLVDSNATGYLFNGCTGLRTVVAPAEMDTAIFRHLDNDWIKDLTYQIVYNKSYALNYQIKDNAVTVTGFKKIDNASAVSVTIPSSFRGKNITKIGDYAFNRAAVSEVNMPDTVTSLGDYAFSDATSMKKIRLSAGLVWNAGGGNLFNGLNTTLEEIVVPETENAKLFALSHMQDIKCLWPYIKRVTDPEAQRFLNTMKNDALTIAPGMSWNIPDSGWAREKAKYELAHYIHMHFCDYITYDGSKPALGTAYCLSTGYGVCGTMARSYLLLLKMVGFRDDEMELIGAPGHELTGIKLFDEWYFVECTNSYEDDFAMRYQNEWYRGTPAGSYDGFVKRLQGYEQYYYYTGGATDIQVNAASEAELAQKYKAVYPRGDVNHDGVFNNADKVMMQNYRNGANVQPNLVMSYVRCQLSNPNAASYWI